MSEERNEKSHNCSFCGEGQSKIKHLIAAPNNIFICDKCVTLCQSILEGEEKHHTEGLSKEKIKEQKELCYTMFSTIAMLQKWLVNELKALDDAEKKLL